MGMTRHDMTYLGARKFLLGMLTQVFWYGDLNYASGLSGFSTDYPSGDNLITTNSVNAGFVQGITPKGNGSVNLNYRDKRVNVFGNVGADRGIYHTLLDIYRIQNDTLFDHNSENINNNKSYSAKAGADFFLNKKKILIPFCLPAWFANSQFYFIPKYTAETIKAG